MSSWSMNDGSALTGTYTFTNNSTIVQGNSSADTSEIKVGDIVIDDAYLGGEHKGKAGRGSENKIPFSLFSKEGIFKEVK